ncbi:nuclear transport factor 2 family protein [Sphingobium amiense]|uniref:Nuclear transport factor 2 family protein n=1 Tax=Sphingobium amiense TaxID=135719 RepID=A0A494WFX6_9SPHN|nr:nuclear transport factor 2 family protein [Sphingobium amiense]BBD99970.1 nuclear transport factor 2 family protein [Sphingobium amiense]
MNKLMTGVAGLVCLTASPALAQVSPSEYAVARAEIVNLSNRLMIAFDAQDADTYADSFSKNAVLNFIGGVENGREAIRKGMAAWWLKTSAAAPVAPDATSRPRTHHFVVNHSITIDKDGKTGKGILYWFALTNRTPQKDVQPLYFGHVVEYYVKEDGKWLYSKRDVYNESLTNRSIFYPELGEKDPRAPK